MQTVSRLTPKCQDTWVPSLRQWERIHFQVPLDGWPNSGVRFTFPCSWSGGGWPYLLESFPLPVCEHLHLRSSKGKLKFNPFSIGSSLTSPAVFFFHHISLTPAGENSVFKGSDDKIGPIKITHDNFPTLTSAPLNDICKTPLCHVVQAIHRF